jgi:TonB family protein
MNRTQKKCFIAATSLHLLLALVLIVGPGFLASSSKPQDVPVMTFIPMITTDSAMSGGGNPKAAPPPPAPPLVQPAPPAPTPPQRVEPTPPPEPPRTRVVEPVPTVEATTPPKHVIKIEPKIVTRNSTTTKADTRRLEDDRAKDLADRRKFVSDVINKTVTGIRGDLSPNTTIKFDDFQGPGGGGIPYGNWLQAVKKVYTDAWLVPDGVTDDSATVTVSITIGRDGTVISSSVARSSSNGLVNHSVEAALNRVRYAPPLPEGAKESQRTVTINFNLKAKQGLG